MQTSQSFVLLVVIPRPTRYRSSFTKRGVFRPKIKILQRFKQDNLKKMPATKRVGRDLSHKKQSATELANQKAQLSCHASHAMSPPRVADQIQTLFLFTFLHVIFFSTKNYQRYFQLMNAEIENPFLREGNISQRYRGK